ncbi:sensor domain-containing diguanylate cyclase [Orrella sp. JC864]|uniref:diguanylate cyclase domain-containing protein n=1 Tax=Orrella sp. JC864 TaxID=3120298 RepID=UPI0012BD62A3
MKEFLDRASKGESLSSRDLHIVLDAMPIPLSWATLHDRRIRFTNRAFRTVLGYEDGSFATVEDWIERAYVRQADRDEARLRWQRLWESGVSGISEVPPWEVQVRRADGELLAMLHRGILLHDIGVGIATFEDISDSKRAEEALRRIAFEDPLTRLMNRRALQHRWADEPAQARGPAALLLIDLDGFKPVNDQLGHDAGDEVLVAVAACLRASVGAAGTVYRLGGDEFVVLLSGIRGAEDVERACWRIGTAIRQPMRAGGRTVTVGSSIGVSLYPQDAADLQGLLKQADEALYRVKRLEKGGWGWFKNPERAA